MTDTRSIDRGLLIRKAIVLFIGVFFYASGIAFTKNCNMGISPIVSVAYALSMLIPVTLGWCSTIFNLFLLAGQRILLRKDFPIYMMAAQLVMSIIFSIFIDLCGAIWSFAVPEGYIVRLIFFIFGCFILAIGVFLVVKADFVMLTAEGMVNAIVKVTGFKFGNVKVGFDASMIVLTCLISLIFIGHIEGIREGTIIAVLLIGNFTKVVGKLCDRAVTGFLEGGNRS